MPEERLAIYFMDEQGYYNEPIWLPASEVAEKVRSEVRNYHEIRVVDADDKLCFRVVKGEVVFPRKDVLLEYLRRQCSVRY